MSASIANNIRLKRVYDPPSPDDGWRVLSMRYWPRGISRALVDEYTTKTAPSRELLREFKHEALSWDDYVIRYLEEMKVDVAKDAIAHLAELASSRTITLMCSCEDEARCHRLLLKGLVAEAEQRGGN